MPSILTFCVTFSGTNVINSGILQTSWLLGTNSLGRVGRVVAVSSICCCPDCSWITRFTGNWCCLPAPCAIVVGRVEEDSHGDIGDRWLPAGHSQLPISGVNASIDGDPTTAPALHPPFVLKGADIGSALRRRGGVMLTELTSPLRLLVFAASYLPRLRMPLYAATQANDRIDRLMSQIELGSGTGLARVNPVTAPKPVGPTSVARPVDGLMR